MAILVLASALTLGACSSPTPKDGPPGPPPARVESPAKEAELSTVVLTPEAERRLAIETVEVEEREVPAVRTTGAEIVAPAGRAVTVSAPLAGTLLAPEGGIVPTAGAAVGRGQVVFRLRPLPGPLDLTAADARLEATRARVRRAEELLEAGATSVRALEEARAELAAAESSARSLEPSADAGSGDVLVMASPVDGLVGGIHVAPGQSVAAAAALFDVVARDPLWARVPVYVGDVSAVDRDREATVRSHSRAAGEGRPARPVEGPPTADPSAATLDLYYEVRNREGVLRPGERVEVTLPLRQEKRSPVVPWSSVVFDFDGGTWVYEEVASHSFARRRVAVRRVDGEIAVLSRGPRLGARVVSVGAAELLGTELGTGK